MNRWLERAILLNLIMLILFVYTQYWSIRTIADGLSEIHGYPSLGNITSLRAYGRFEYFTEIYIDGYYIANGSGQAFRVSSGSIPHFSILLFLITVILNLLIVWKMSRREMS
jgi:hypothetical protein